MIVPPDVEWSAVAPVGVTNLKLELQKLTDAGFFVCGVFTANAQNFTVTAYKPRPKPEPSA